MRGTELRERDDNALYVRYTNQYDIELNDVKTLISPFIQCVQHCHHAL